MSWLLIAAVATGCSILVLVLTNVYLYVFLRERFVKTWALAWGSFALGYLLQAAGLLWQGSFPVPAAYQLCLTIWAVLMLNGTRQFLGRSPSGWPALAGTVVALWCLLASGLGFPPAYATISLCAFVSLTDILIGVQILKHLRDKEFAGRILAWLYILWGIHFADYPVLGRVEWFAPWGFMLGGLFALSVAVGMLLVYFERTHRFLQENEGRYRDLVESSHDWIWEIDEEGRFTHVNPLTTDLLGYHPGEILGKTTFDLMPEAEVRRTEEIFKDIWSRRVPFKGLEYLLLNKDKTPVLLETSGVPFFGARGTFLGYRGVGRDISEARRAEDALRESATKHRSILQTAMEGFWLADATGRILEVNEASCLISGYDADELLTMHISDLEVNETPAEIAARIRAIMSLDKIRFETRHRRKDGRIIDVEVSVRYGEIGGGCCLAFLRDITERKKAEAALRESEFFFKESQRCASIGSYKADFVADYWASSEILDAIFGIDERYRRDVSGWLSIVHPEDRDALQNYLQQQVIGQGKPFSREYRIVRQNDGEVRWVQGLGAVTRDARGEVSTLMGTILDITERKLAEEERDQLERQLLHTQKLESLGVLAGGIAHDFNNILTSIVGNADLALRRMDGESPAADNLRQIERAAARASDLAGQMLAYSGKGKFMVEDIDLNRLLQEMLHMLEVSISKKALLRLDFEDALPPVGADATQLRQIVMNLVINASEAIGDAGGFIAIATRSVQCDSDWQKEVRSEDGLAEGRYVCLEVTDSGCGMDAETKAKIFDPFFTTKFTGRGLGMAAVLGIVRGHRGDIRVSSEPGRGSTFTVLLPASDGPAKIDDRTLPSGDWKGSGKVLLVDDEEWVRDIGCAMLEELGYCVVTARDGMEAVEIFKNTPEVSIVVLDLNMPNMDGKQCFDELRKLRPEVAIFMSSGYNEQEIGKQFAGKGLAGFVQKPYTYEMLKRAFSRLSAAENL